MWKILAPLLRALPPETAHSLVLRLVRVIGWSRIAKSIIKKTYHTEDKPVELWGIRFKNRVGLAAGWDKDGLAIDGLSAFGFGHIEVGTVTPEPQLGREKPRIFRLDEDESLINRMGFPSLGEDQLAHRLLYRPKDVVVGVNIGKNARTHNDDAHVDYNLLLSRFTTHADYIVINVSSPNTPGLRSLQSRDSLEKLLGHVRTARSHLTRRQALVPVLLKVSPDLSEIELEDVIGVALDHHIDGFIATNTTTSRENLKSPNRFEAGGASGKILTHVSRECLKRIVHQVDGKVPIISSGGIMTAEEGKVRVDMGASLVQLYTGFVYRGPRLVKELNKML